MRNEAMMNEEMTEMEMTQVCGGQMILWRTEGDGDEMFRSQAVAAAPRSGCSGFSSEAFQGRNTGCSTGLWPPV